MKLEISNFDAASYLSKISSFVESVLEKSKKQKVVLAISGGIDSATALYILKNIIPVKNIFVVHLYYFKESIPLFKTVIDPLGIPKQNVLLYSIRDLADQIANELQINSSGSRIAVPAMLEHKRCRRGVRDDNVFAQDDKLNKMRLGNIMARVRMIYVFDLAKKLDALVCGTENRTENLLGYFTRFGDAASDFEVINSLFKTEVQALASKLQVPQDIIDALPSAGLWEGQTDEKELGFTYEEMDCVLRDYFDNSIPIEKIEEKGFKNAKKIIGIVKKNKFKHDVPYLMEISLTE